MKGKKSGNRAGVESRVTVLKATTGHFFPVILILILLCAVPAWAADPWSKADVQREVACVVLNIADLATTLKVRNDHLGGVYEANPIFGRKPSDGELIMATAASSILHLVVTDLVPAKWRLGWQYGFIGIKAIVVGNNLRVGFSFEF